ncbi:hypothetical protein [Lentzea sp. NEAU-D7]|uniref:hypothetical protein n=1 Tax=Lentzea sp. NEAU-D7 TaxID=2994667 RepID=UPI00224A78E5|nr:hypothetical protein [Lentzea sp. NEAU-D7]MCX2948573.1 hypothetical protein [Lentzea sp. NEAU-D7]
MSARARRAAPVVAVLALLVAVGAGAWAVWGDGSGNAYASDVVTTPDPTPRLPYVESTDPLVDPPGDIAFKKTGRTEIFERDTLLSEDELEIARATGVAKIDARVTRRTDGTVLGVWRFTLRDGADPFAALDEFDGLYKRGNHQLVPGGDDVLLRRFVHEDDSAVYHAHYVRGRDVLRVDGYGPSATDQVVDLLERQLARSPAEAEPE